MTDLHSSSPTDDSALTISRVGDFTLGWGESLVWDDVRNRLYFVDCAVNALHWLDDGATTPQTLVMPSLATCVVLTPDGSLVAVLDDGLHRVDPDDRSIDFLSPYPDAIGGRCNDACADLDGNIITGKLNLGADPGSAWQYSTSGSWTLLDDDISNTNGPAALTIDGQSTLIVGDTAAHYYAYDYDAAAATVGPRRVFGDVTDLTGSPDGSTVDADGALWCALVLGGSQLARFTPAGFDRSIALDVTNPTDVTFGGPALDRLYVTSIGGDGELDGALLVVDGLDVSGRTEPRAHLT